MASTPTSVYERLGSETIGLVIQEFYERAFRDPLIGHFFFHSDINHLVKMQTDFAIAMLGGPKNYKGEALKSAHARFNIRRPHFMRRQKLMEEVLLEQVSDQEAIAIWLAKEQALQPLVIHKANFHQPCNS